jgi:hypothetical protein
MTQLEWYKHKDGKESMWWSKFKADGDIGLITKFKASGDGYNPEAYGPYELEGYLYSAVQKTSKAGKPYFDIERRPKGAVQSTAPTTSNNNEAYWKEKEAKQAARDVQFETRHKESMKAMQTLTEAIALNTQSRKEEIMILDLIRQHVEVLAKGETARSSFKTATVEANSQ